MDGRPLPPTNPGIPMPRGVKPPKVPSTDDIRRALDQVDEDFAEGFVPLPLGRRVPVTLHCTCGRPRRSRAAVVLTIIAIAAVAACAVWGRA